MDSVRMDSTVPLAEIKPGPQGMLARIAAPSPYVDAKPRGATTGVIVDQDADQGLTFDSATERSGSFRCVETFEKNRHVLRARDEPITVAIVDGDTETRFFLQRILEQSGGYRCVGTYTSGEEALRKIPGAHPRIVLMDVRMPGISGIECMRRLKGRLPGLIVVLVSELTDPETMSEALAAGGDGYLTKPFTTSQCLATLRFAIRHGGSGTSDSADARVSSTRGSLECALLTDREEEVIRCFAKGLLYKETAAELGISYSTVHKHQHNIFKKFHVTNRTEAIRVFGNLKPG